LRFSNSLLLAVAYSPLQAIGWASIFADLGGLMVLSPPTLLILVGNGRIFVQTSARAGQSSSRPKDVNPVVAGLEFCACSRGFLHGAYYPGATSIVMKRPTTKFFPQMSFSCRRTKSAQIKQSSGEYGQLQGDKEVKIARAPLHIIEFGLLAIFAAGFFQPYVQARWKCGSAGGPSCCSRLTLVADLRLLENAIWPLAVASPTIGGLLVIVASLAMWIAY